MYSASCGTEGMPQGLEGFRHVECLEAVGRFTDDLHVSMLCQKEAEPLP